MLLQVDCGVPVRYPYQPMTAYSIGTGDEDNIWDFDSDDAAPLVLTFESDLTIQLFDQDVSLMVDQSDFLGCYGMTNATNSPMELTDGNGAKYKLHFTKENWGES